MASVQSLGLGSGVLTNDLVDKLVSAEREVSELRLNNRQDLVDAKITAYGEIKSLLSKIQSTASSLSSPSLVGSTIVKSSDESILTATGSATADPGTYNVEVLNTAKSHALATGSYGSIDEIIGTGKLVFTFGELEYSGDNVIGQNSNAARASKTITIDDSNRTLAGIRDSINNAKMGVTATIVNDGNGYRLLMSSTETGVQNAIRIEAQDSSGAPLSGGLSALNFNENQAPGTGLTQTSRAEDAQVRVNGLTITRSSNAIDEVVKGVTLNLKNADVGKNVSIEVSPDTKLLTDTIQTFVDTYNDLKEFVDSLSTFDSATKTGGLLMGDSAVRSMMSQMRALISQPIVGLSGKYRSLTELGVNTNTNNKNLLDFDTAKFSKALNEDRSNLIGLLAKTGVSTDSQIIYVNDSINTKPGTFDIEITQLATQAKYQGASLSASSFVIDGSNNNFTINVNGQIAAIELTQGAYSSGDELAKQIAMQINSHDDMIKYGHSVSVEYDTAQQSFAITSNKYGSSSSVYFTSVDANTANTLGFNTLGGGPQSGVGLTTLSAEAFNGKGATSLTGLRTLDADKGIDFSASNATFSLAVDGGAAVPITVNLNAAGNDLNNDGIYGDRKDTLQAIQTAIDASSLNGQVVASFDKNGYLLFQTTGVGAARSIEVSNVGSSTSDVLLGLNGNQGAISNGKNVGLNIGAPIEFNISVDGTTSAQKVSVPAGTYYSGQELADAIKAQLNSSLSADANFSGKVKGAETAVASRDISTAIDFSSANAGFRLNVSGVEREILVTGNSGNNIADIQSALDSAYGSGVVVASLSGNGLKLSTVATGHQQYIEVNGDGRGARSSTFADISTGINFSAGNAAAFTLNIDGANINVNVTGDGTAGSNDSSSNLRVIQKAVDDALVATGQFAEGDIQAKVDSNGNLYFETMSKNGVRTASTFGSSSNLTISNVSVNASSLLGLSAGSSSNGYDGLGFNTNRTFGYDLDADVVYHYDNETKLGSFEISVGGRGTQIEFSDLDSNAIAILGLREAGTYQVQAPKGKDVAGKINGVEATGDGQFLRASDGTIKATNGYYIANEATDFSTPVELTAANNTFKISVDGVEAEISLNVPATYNSGSALASALEAAINNNAAYKDKGIAVKVDFTNDPTSFAHNKFGIISATTGDTSEVKMISVPAGTAEVFGFIPGVADGAKGKAQVGSTDDASGLRLKVTGGNIGSRGSVTYVSGFGDLLKDIMDGFLNGKNSIVTTRENAFERETTSISEAREKLDARMAAQEARLKSQFAYNDSIVASLNMTLDYVKQQFEAMNNSKK